MNSILKIHKPENTVHILWEHILKSALAFTGTFALLFFGPLLLSGKSRSRHHGNTDNDPGLLFIKFIIEHPEIQFGVSILAVLIYNLIIIKNNSKKNYAVSIDIDNYMVIIGKTNLYYKEVENVSLPLENLTYTLVTKTSDAGEKQSTLRFIDKTNRKIIAAIKPSHIIWNNQVRDIRLALRELDSLGVNKDEHNSTYTSVLGSLFKR
jgi:hypothetical protein